MYWMGTALVHHSKLDICQTMRISHLKDVNVTTGEHYEYRHEIIYAPIELSKQRKTTTYSFHYLRAYLPGAGGGWIIKNSGRDILENWSEALQLMPWLLASPGRQQPWC